MFFLHHGKVFRPILDLTCLAVALERGESAEIETASSGCAAIGGIQSIASNATTAIRKQSVPQPGCLLMKRTIPASVKTMNTVIRGFSARSVSSRLRSVCH
jgi:hypothetical protein